MKYIILSFKDAGLWLSKPKNIKDCVFDAFVYKNGKKWMKRNEHPLARNTILNLFDENLFDKSLIGFEQVSNMLHVLCGCRPVPTYKETFRKRQTFIDEITKNVWCKVTNSLYFTDKNDIKRPIYEIVQGRKFVPNANRNDIGTYSLLLDKRFDGDYFTWDTFKKRLYYTDECQYNFIINKLKEWYGKDSFSKDYSLVDLLVYLSVNKGLKDEMLDFFKLNKTYDIFSKIVKYAVDNEKYKVTGFNNAKESNENYNLAKLVVNYSPLYKLCISGEFIIPIKDDKIYNIIMNGVRFCTFLEKGVVSIKDTTDYIDEDYLESEGFEQIFLEKDNANKIEINDL